MILVVKLEGIDRPCRQPSYQLLDLTVAGRTIEINHFFIEQPRVKEIHRTANDCPAGDGIVGNVERSRAVFKVTVDDIVERYVCDAHIVDQDPVRGEDIGAQILETQGHAAASRCGKALAEMFPAFLVSVTIAGDGLVDQGGGPIQQLHFGLLIGKGIDRIVKLKDVALPRRQPADCLAHNPWPRTAGQIQFTSGAVGVEVGGVNINTPALDCPVGDDGSVQPMRTGFKGAIQDIVDQPARHPHIVDDHAVRGVGIDAQVLEAQFHAAAGRCGEALAELLPAGTVGVTGGRHRLIDQRRCTIQHLHLGLFIGKGVGRVAKFKEVALPGGETGDGLFDHTRPWCTR